MSGGRNTEQVALSPWGVAARGPPVGVLRSAAHRRVESRLPVRLRGVFIIAVHHAFALGLTYFLTDRRNGVRMCGALFTLAQSLESLVLQVVVARRPRPPPRAASAPP